MRGAGSRVKRPRPKRGGEELGGEGAKRPQAESTLTYALPSLVSKWFTGIRCQGSPGFSVHFDIVCLPVNLICGHPVIFREMIQFSLSNDLKILNCSQFHLLLIS